MANIFHKIAQYTSESVGRPWAFILALLAVGIWAFSGPVFGYSDTWQLVINTGTTILTFLIVFLIQNTQNRDAKAIHLKLDELIRSQKTARNKLVDVESLSDLELKELQEEFSHLREKTALAIEKRAARKALRKQSLARVTTDAITE